MIYKVGISGASGRVGQELCSLLSEGFLREGDCLELADAVTGSGRMTSIEGVSARTFEDPPREPVHVWIDFSRPESTLRLLAEARTPVVIGTTGFTAEQLKEVERFSRRQPVLLAPNTSPGMNLMRMLLEHLPPGVASQFSLVMAEEHHRFKKDAPSGTAKMLLEVVKGKGFENPPVHVTRAGGILGTHSVKLISDSEELEISHKVMNRRVFAEGALLAALFLVKRKEPGMYSMDDVFLSQGNDSQESGDARN